MLQNGYARDNVRIVHGIHPPLNQHGCAKAGTPARAHEPLQDRRCRPMASLSLWRGRACARPTCCNRITHARQASTTASGLSNSASMPMLRGGSMTCAGSGAQPCVTSAVPCRCRHDPPWCGCRRHHGSDLSHPDHGQERVNSRNSVMNRPMLPSSVPMSTQVGV